MNKISAAAIVLLSIFSNLNAQGHIAVSPDLEGQQLYEAVSNNFTPVIDLSYGEARDILFGEVYRDNDSLHCIYTDWSIRMPPGQDPTQVVYQDGNGINTEHIWPQSLGAGSLPPRADMHHLFPSRVNVNADRGSLKFGEVPDNATSRWYYLSSTLTSPPTNNRDSYSEYLQSNSFEPREVAKGNIARAIFYFNTIYRTQANNEGAGFFDSQRAVLCQWHIEDPIDEEEWDKTFQIAAHQSDKPNPFIIDCTLAARMYCPEILDEMCVTVGNTSVFETLEVKVFPNPSRGQNRLIGHAQEAGLLQLFYYNSQGKQVQNEVLQITQGAFELELDLPYPGYWRCEIRLTGESNLYQSSLPLIVIP